MHSWVFRQREQLQRIYGFPESLLSDEGLESEPGEPPSAAEDASGPVDGEPTPGAVRRIAVTPMPRRVR